MLQRVRDAVGRRVNVIHRLDRGASGCLVFSFADDESASLDSDSGVGATTAMMNSMASSDAQKTYVALVHGDGKWNGEDLLQKGWFTIDVPVKDENGKRMKMAKPLMVLSPIYDLWLLPTCRTMPRRMQPAHRRVSC